MAPGRLACGCMKALSFPISAWTAVRIISCTSCITVLLSDNIRSRGSAGVSSRSRMPSSMNSVSVIPGCIFTYRSTCVYTSRGRRTETVTGFSASDSYANGLPRFAMVCFLLVQVVHLYYSITIIYYRWEWQEASDKMYYRNTLGCAGEEAHGGG